MVQRNRKRFKQKNNNNHNSNFICSLIIEHLLKDRSDCEIATMHCSANVTPAYVIYKFTQVNMKFIKMYNAFTFFYCSIV